MQVSIVGCGYVGLVTGVCLAEKGHSVTCVDVDCTKVARINDGKAPIYERDLESLLRQHVGGRFQATTDLSAAVMDSELTMVAVGTPTRETSMQGGRIDLTYVKAAAQQIGRILADKDGYHTVVVKSTVVPGTTDDVVRPILEDASGKQAGRNFGLGCNPEFLSEGTAVEDFLQPDRIILGGIDPRTQAALAELYNVFPQEIPRLATSNKAAEMIKYASNSLLATLISFSNELGNLCSALGGVDVREVLQGVHHSQYLTTRAEDGRRTTAPIASFLEAGCGFGGSCLPKDVAALVQHGQDQGQAMPLLSSVLQINRDQPRRMVELLKQRLPTLAGKTIAVLGLAFKPGTDDVRETPALEIVRRLLEEGGCVRAYDPIANDNFAQALGDARVVYCDRLAEALDEADAALLVTRWDEFAQLPQMLTDRLPAVPLVDGRRVIPPNSVDQYLGIGM